MGNQCVSHEKMALKPSVSQSQISSLNNSVIERPDNPQTINMMRLPRLISELVVQETLIANQEIRCICKNNLEDIVENHIAHVSFVKSGEQEDTYSSFKF